MEAKQSKKNCIIINFSIYLALVFSELGCNAAALENKTIDVISQPSKIQNLIAYKEQDKFCGWPANEGIWSWGDEILVGFEIAAFSKSEKSHSIDRNSEKYIYFVRSKDGGQTWMVEKPKDIQPPAYLEDPNMFKTEESKISRLNEKMDFQNPDFTMKLRGNNFYYSYERGHSWKGPFILPDFGQKLIMARTDYVILNKDECLIFISSSQTDGNYGKSLAVKTHNGGLNWEFVGWMTSNFPPEEYKKFSFSIMPSTIMPGEQKLISALRQRFERDVWIDIYQSDDFGKTWKFLSKAADNINNPPSLIKLKDGRLCLIYCKRTEPFGLCAKISKDEGKTWSQQIVLRDDALSWDIGYVRSMQRPDGKVVCLYYYHTKENPQQHIAATIWEP
ncbi:MAG: hypothetical protein A2Y10_01135 [Planctomycetes bacterium GWF2_41_51]|nr:MAG: hypothetical protein A2Y10_01135 [Planctomycetes bacterium GWF2_41_51]HBG26550.1 hypothetical protein [Phycisphaerales bacterium]